ncbi:MAG: hypothetical protein ACLTG4_11960 [Oscillospiraceae bacterium]
MIDQAASRTTATPRRGSPSPARQKYLALHQVGQMTISPGTRSSAFFMATVRAVFL